MAGHDVDGGAQTVLRIAEYFAELKQAVSQFAETTAVTQRGYFSATEDHRARGLLISYWHARNALLELVSDYRRRVARLEEADDGEFLVPFAAALLLIDAARFLRGLAEDQPVVRRKFNEPEPAFGIPGGTYDTVQKSLVSTRNAWHMYHALRYFELHRQRLTSSLPNDTLRQTLAIAERLSEELDISFQQFALVKLRTRSDQWLRKLGRSTVVRAVYGLQKLAGEMLSHISVRPGHEPRLPVDIQDALRGALTPGDVCLVRKEYAITNYFLPGHWPHVALYLGSPETVAAMGSPLPPARLERWLRADSPDPERVLESMKDGVLFRPLASPFASDSIVIMRPKLPVEQIAAALRNAYLHEGKPYDFDFDFRRSDRLVCTEVVYRSYEGIGPIRFDLIRRAGRPTLSGHDLIQMGLAGHHFELVAAYIPSLDTQPVWDPDSARTLVDETLKGPGASLLGAD